MTLSSVVLVFSALALITSFALVLAKERDHRRWRSIVAVALLSLVVNGGLEVIKRTAEARREQAARGWESEQRTTQHQMLSDIQSVNQSAAQAFARLEEIAKSLPAATVVMLTEKARQVQVQLDTVTKAPERGVPAAELKSSIEEAEARVRELSSAVELERTKQHSNPAMPTHPNKGILASVEPVQRISSAETESPSAQPPLHQARDTIDHAPLPVKNEPSSSRPPSSPNVPIVAIPLPVGTAEERQDEGCTRITAPKAGESVGAQGDAQGTVSQVPKDGYLWVLVRRDDQPKDLLWPQHGVPVKDLKGNPAHWELSVSYGERVDMNKNFRVVAVVVDEATQARLARWLEEAPANAYKPWIGMPRTVQGCGPASVVVKKVAH